MASAGTPGERALDAAHGLTPGFKSAMDGREVSGQPFLAHELTLTLAPDDDLLSSLPDALLANVLLRVDPSGDFRFMRGISRKLQAKIERLCNRVNLLERLPVELVLHVLSFLDVRSLLAVGRTCRALRDLSNEPILWQNRYFRIWFSRSLTTLTDQFAVNEIPARVPRRFITGTPRSILDSDLSWRALVLERLRLHLVGLSVRRFARNATLKERPLKGGLTIHRFCAYRGWADALVLRAADRPAAEQHLRRMDFLIAEEGYATALAIRPASLFLYNDWALCVHTRAEYETLEPLQRALFRSTFALYSIAALVSENLVSFCNWGLACNKYERLHDWPE
eukprot:Amastigsp_a852946_4.p1 type:complete len:338 gc:universal Amastigsp_a852946_4:58-1071(+)